jgi:glycosyltransferase involved in cell wall biosynthesis
MLPRPPSDKGSLLVSVIMNCYNGEQYLQAAIDSVFAQTYANWELLLWDNASTDGTRAIALACTNDKRFRYFRAETNTSLGTARNKAIHSARGDLIAFLDCDDRWLSDKLTQQVALLESRPDVDFVYGNFYFTRPSNEHLHLGFKRRQMEGQIFAGLLRYFSINLQTVIVRKSALDALPELFDVNLSLAEDYDLFLRVLYSSEAAYIHSPLVIYRMHSGMSSIRYAEKYPEELIYCIDKLKRLHPDLGLRYGREMAYLDGKAAYWRARLAISQGNVSAGRAFLKPHRGKSPAFFLLYYTTYLTSGLWNKLQDLRFFLR